MSAGLRLLGSILDSGSTTTLRLLQRDDLMGAEEVEVYDFVRNHFRRYSELPTAETVEENTGYSLPEAPEHVEFYVDEVRARRTYNIARSEFPVLREHVMDGDVEGMLASSNIIRSACLPYSGQQAELQDARDIADTVARNVSDHALVGGLPGIPTGFFPLDEESGGYQNSDLIVWVARPGIGKTHLLIHGMRTAWEVNRSTLFVSMEMGLHQIGMRWAAHHANLNPDHLKKGRIGYWDRKRLEYTLEAFRDMPHAYFYAGNFNKNTSDLDILIQELNPDCVYIDGLYLMTPSHKGRMGRFERTAFVVDELKSIALMRNRPLVCTTQFSRQSVGKTKDGDTVDKSSLETIGYTDALSTHSSIILGVAMGQAVPEDIVRMESFHNDEADQWEERRIVVARKDSYPTRVIRTMKGREGESAEFGINYRFAPLDFNVIPLSVALGESRDQEREERPVDTNFMELRQ